MEVVLARITQNSHFPCGLELQSLSTRAGDLLCIVGWCEPDLEPHAAFMWWPWVWIQFGIQSGSYSFIPMKTRPSSLLLPSVVAALVRHRASLLVRPVRLCLAAGN